MAGLDLSVGSQEFIPKSASVPSSPVLSASSPSFVPRPSPRQARQTTHKTRNKAVKGRQRANSDSPNTGFGFAWSVFVDCLACVVDKNVKKDMSENSFRDQMECLGGFNSKDVFDKRFLHRLDQVKSTGLACRVFKSGVRPVWEDPKNSGMGAGKWVIQGENERVVTAAFHAILAKLTANGKETAGLNGCVFACKRGQHVVMLWAMAHPKGSRGEDPYSVRKLVSSIAEQIGHPLVTSFKQHGKKGRSHGKSNSRSVPSSPMLKSNSRSVPSSPMLSSRSHKKGHGKRSPCLSPSLPGSPVIPWSQDSNYSLPSPRMSPILLSSPTVVASGPPQFAL